MLLWTQTSASVTVWHLGRLKSMSMCCCHSWALTVRGPLSAVGTFQLVTSIMAMREPLWRWRVATGLCCLCLGRSALDEQRQCAPCLKHSARLDSPAPLNQAIVPPWQRACFTVEWPHIFLEVISLKCSAKCSENAQGLGKMQARFKKQLAAPHGTLCCFHCWVLNICVFKYPVKYVMGVK